MSNTATEQMLSAIQTIKESARQAEQEYDRRADALQEKANQTIDLFGGTAVSQIADLAAASKNICDQLYAAYQSLVTILDGQCRPLLDQAPELTAVRAVRDTIQWLNSESEIENNFTASFHSHNLGEVASVRYMPAIESRMIQTFWETTYRALPGREAFERREKEEAELKEQEEAALRKALYEKSLKRSRAAEEQYQADLKAWQAAAAQAQSQRSAMLSDLEAAERKRLEAASHDTFHITSAQIEAEKQNDRADLAQAQASLSSLGLLQFGEKIRWKKKIEELNLRLAEAEQKLLAARNIRDQGIRSIASRIEQKQAQWQHSAEKAYPIPEEPCPPGMTPQQFENRKYQDAIYQTLSQHEKLTLEELQEKCHAVHDLSIFRIRALLRQMEDRVICEEIKYKLFFSAAPAKTPKESAAENHRYRQAIYEYILSVGCCTVSDISNNCMDVLTLPIQQVSKLTFQLYNEGKLHRTADGMFYPGKLF